MSAINTLIDNLEEKLTHNLLLKLCAEHSDELLELSEGIEDADDSELLRMIGLLGRVAKATSNSTPVELKNVIFNADDNWSDTNSLFFS